MGKETRGTVNPRHTLAALTLSLFFVSVSVAADFTGQVVGVSDGDTLSVMHNGGAEKVRLNGIDCPEKGQAFGQRAKKETSSRAFGRQVTVHLVDKDRYGRTVATVVLPDGANLNHELVKGGWCWWYRKYAPADNELEALEQAARQAKKGLWVDPRPVAPWDYRKAQRSAKSSAPALADSRSSVSPNDTGIVGNKDSHRYHHAGCPSYDDIAPDNRVAFESEHGAEVAGYRLAGNCP